MEADIKKGIDITFMSDDDIISITNHMNKTSLQQMILDLVGANNFIYNQKERYEKQIDSIKQILNPKS